MHDGPRLFYSRDDRPIEENRYREKIFIYITHLRDENRTGREKEKYIFGDDDEPRVRPREHTYKWYLISFPRVYVIKVIKIFR